MTFQKIAYVTSLATATAVNDGLKRIAAKGDDTPDADELMSIGPKSYYIDGARKVDVRAMLKVAAEKYNISEDPAHYIFEAIRANTANVPNENHDGFHKDELLRFDTRLAKPVYMTYVGKPHHLNHKTDDPKRARGVVLDAHYNDDSAPLEFCPTCNHRTAEESERDPSGIHCAKCGSVVKDEFVEVLIAVDTQKDEDLIRGIQAGILNAVSMGCNCASTVCNVCDHVAKSVHDFCTHIRQGAKGSFWTKKGSKFERLSQEDVRNLIRHAGYMLPTGDSHLVSVSLVLPDGTVIKKAFEYCRGVEYDEVSRVHRPADPKALTVEILKAAAASNINLTIQEETTALIRSAQLARLEASMSKAASTQGSTYFAVRVNGNDEDIHVAATLADAVSKAALGKRDKGDYFTFTASADPATAMYTAARHVIAKTAQYLPLTSDVSLVVPDGMQVNIDPTTGQPVVNGQPGMGAPGAPGMGAPGSNAVMPPGPQSIQDVTQEHMAPSDPEQSPEEFGMLPPGAALDTHAEGDVDPVDVEEPQEDYMATGKYAAVYGDFEVEVFTDRAILKAPSGDVLIAKTASKLASDDDKYAFGGELIDSVLANGLVRTALKFKADLAPFAKRVADATDGAVFDMAEKPSTANGGVLEGAVDDMQMARPNGKASGGAALKDADDDMKNESRPNPKNTIESRDTDMADEAKTSSPTESATDDAEDDMQESRDGGEDNALADASFDMKVKASARVIEERQKKLYASRLEKQKTDHAKEIAELKATHEASKKVDLERVKRAMKIAQKRRSLNQEESPLKATMLDSLTVTRPIGVSAQGNTLEYQGLRDDLALHLVEAAWDAASDAEVDTLIARTAEILAYDDKYLVSIESDLAKQASAIPQVVHEEQLEPSSEVQRRAAHLRQAVNDGNLPFAPATTDAEEQADRRSAISRAVGSTIVSRTLNEAFRPN